MRSGRGNPIRLLVLVLLLTAPAAPVLAAEIESPSPGVYVLSNDRMARTIEAPAGGALRNSGVVSLDTGGETPLCGDEFVLVTDHGELRGADFRVTKAEPSQAADSATLRVELAAHDWVAVAQYELRDGRHFDTRTLGLEYTGPEAFVLDRVWVGAYTAPGATRIIKTATSASDLAAFVRGSHGGVLLNVDFPYSEIEVGPDGTSVRLGYALGDSVGRGYRHAAEPMNLGVYALDGVAVGVGGGVEIDFERAPGAWATNADVAGSVITADGPDRGELRAFRRMYEILAPSRRGTAQIHYQTYDDMDPRHEQASIMDRPETLYRDIELAVRWGFNSYGLYEDHNVFLPERPPLEVVADVTELASRSGLSFGSGCPCNYGTGFFWKSEPKPWPSSEWAVLDAEGNRQESVQCWAAPGFVDHLLDRDGPWLQRYDWTSWGLDFFIVNPCHDPAHGHPLGRASFYKQMKAAVEYHRRLRELSKEPDGFLICTWLGYEPWMPKIGKWADFFYMSDPANSWPIPAVNLHEQMAAGYRRMYRRLNLEQGVPGYMLQNPIFLANWRDGLIRDAETYQHSLIALLAFSPNINVQQPWRFLESLTVKEHEAAHAFFPKWFRYAKDNFDTLCNLIVLSEAPAPGVLEAYAHPSDSGDKCVLVFINTNFFRMERKLTLDSTLGLKDTGKPWMIREEFPQERWRVIDRRTRWHFGDSLRLSVPPKTTMLLEVIPWTPVEPGGLRWYGLPEGQGAAVEPGVWRFQDEQAKTYDVAIEAPAGTHVCAAAARNPEERGAFTDIPVQFLDGAAQFTLTFPPNILSGPVQREITDWVVRPGTLDQGVEQGWPTGIQGETTRFPLASVLGASDHSRLMTEPRSLIHEGKNIGKFMGTMIYHPWFWRMPLEVRLSLSDGDCPNGDAGAASASQEGTTRGAAAFPDCSAYWLSTALSPMAVQNRAMGYTPYFDQHMFIPLPFIDYKNIEEIRAWINGIPAQVEKMDYLMTPPFGEPYEHGSRDFIYYLDGSKNGLRTNFWDPAPNIITLWVRWKE